MAHTQNNNTILPDTGFRVDDWCFAYIERAAMYFVTVTCTNSNVTLLLTFLSALAKVLEDYLDPLGPEVIVDHFSLVSELVDQIVDSSYPRTLDSAALSEYILGDKRRDPSGQPASVPVAVTHVIPWRKEGIDDSSNEVFVDVVEKVDMLVAKSVYDSGYPLSHVYSARWRIQSDAVSSVTGDQTDHPYRFDDRTKRTFAR
jgi:hypothetical protein